MYLLIEVDKTSKLIKKSDKENIIWIDINKVYDVLSYQNLKDFWQEFYLK